MGKLRALDLRSLESVADEMQRLRDQGYERGGNWSLGQIAEHLSSVLRGSLEGFGEGTNKAAWWRAIGPLVLRLVLRTRYIPAGVEAPQTVVPPARVADENAAVAACVELLMRVRDARELQGRHPSFGRLTREQWHDFHCLHSSHHLSFLLPAGN